MIETRNTASPLTLRAASTTSRNSAGTIAGYAAVFNQETVIGGLFPFREQIAPGAFTRAIRDDDVRALFGHDHRIVLGRTSNGTLRLEQDARGLRYDADLPPTAAAADVLALIRRGDVNGSSFAFEVRESGETWNTAGLKAGKLPLRTVHAVAKLIDVSPVTYPAYQDTNVNAREIDMRERTSDDIRIPSRYRSMLEQIGRQAVCRHCRQHVGLNGVARRGFLFHADCADVGELNERAHAASEAGRLRDARARLDAAKPEAAINVNARPRSRDRT